MFNTAIISTSRGLLAGRVDAIGILKVILLDIF